MVLHTPWSRRQPRDSLALVLLAAVCGLGASRCCSDDPLAKQRDAEAHKSWATGLISISSAVNNGGRPSKCCCLAARDAYNASCETQLTLRALPDAVQEVTVRSGSSFHQVLGIISRGSSNQVGGACSALWPGEP